MRDRAMRDGSVSQEKRYTGQQIADMIRQRYGERSEAITIVSDIDKVLLTDEPVILVAIDGQCASGKTTLARMLSQAYDCNVFHMDDFFLQPGQRTKERLAEAGGNVDYERFRQEVIAPLLAGEPVAYREYDCQTGTLKTPVAVPVKRLNIIEGAYSCHPYFGACYQLKYCLRIGKEEQRSRILARNGAGMLERFEREWIPMENTYLKTFGICDPDAAV